MLSKSIYLVICIVLISTFFSCNNVTKNDEVYICTGSYSSKYHSSRSCKGLKACSGSKEHVKIDYAKKIGRTACGYCYNSKKHRVSEENNKTIDCDEVYVCTGSSSTKYHSFKGCKSIEACNGEIIYVDYKEAETDGRTPCGYCFP